MDSEAKQYASRGRKRETKRKESASEDKRHSAYVSSSPVPVPMPPAPAIAATPLLLLSEICRQAEANITTLRCRLALPTQRLVKVSDIHVYTQEDKLALVARSITLYC